MVPSAIILLDALPVSAHGKVDRSELPSPPDICTPPYRVPVGREAVLADLIGSVLAVEQVGLDDDFFDLGGDSLAAIELMAAIDDQFGIDLPHSTLLAGAHPRLAHATAQPQTAARLVDGRRSPRGAGNALLLPCRWRFSCYLVAPRSPTRYRTTFLFMAFGQAGSKSADAPTGASKRVPAATSPTSTRYNLSGRTSLVVTRSVGSSHSRWRAGSRPSARRWRSS